MGVLLFTFFWQKAEAQEANTKKELLFHKWEIATNPIPLFNASIVEPYLSVPSILLRVHKENKSQEIVLKSAFRLRLGLYANSRKADSLGILNINPSTSISVAPSTNFLYLLQIGKEWQKQVGRFQLLYGIDLVHQLEYRKDDLIYTQIGSSTINRLAINPFVGVKFFIDARFAVSMESAWSFFYTKGKRQQKQLSYSDFATNIFPLYAFNFSYYFD
jgi:hypothetical protein